MAIPQDTEALPAAAFEAVFPHLDERQRRLLAGAEARSLAMAIRDWWRRRWRWSSGRARRSDDTASLEDPGTRRHRSTHKYPG